MKKIGQKRTSRLEKKMLRKYIKSQRDKKDLFRNEKTGQGYSIEGGKAMHREGEGCGGWVM